MLRVHVAVLSDDQLFREGLVRILGSEPTIAVVSGIDRPGDKLPLLPRMAGAELDAVSSIEPAQRAAVRHAIDQSFASAFRFVMLDAAALALAAAAAGAAIR